MKTLIKNAMVLTMVDEHIAPMNILVEDGRIKALGDESYEADVVIDGEDALVMPGLVNAHTHIAMSLLRNYADDLDFWPWLTERIWPAEAKLDAEKVYWGSMLSIAEMLSKGITTFSDMYFFTEETIRAVDETGIRANLNRGLTSGEDEEAKLHNALELHQRHHLKGDGRIKIDLGPHAPYTCDQRYLKRILEAGRGMDTRIHIHLSESRKEVKDSYEKHGMSPIQYVSSLGLFDLPTQAAHCVHIDEEDMKILKEKGVSVVNNPSSNLKLANGFAPVSKMLKMGINVAIGTDGPSSNNNQDLFEEMHLAALINKGYEENPTVLKAFEVLKMATVNGAKALGIEEAVGTLEVGKKADLIMIDLKAPHLNPRNNLLSSLVYSVSSADVVLTMVEGRVLYRKGEFLTLNIDKVIKNANEQARAMTREPEDRA